MIERSPDPATYASLADLLRRRRDNSPDQLAYQFLVDGSAEGARLTYQQLDEGARAVAAQLLTRAKPGDRALLLYPPGHEFLLAFFACLRVGVIAVPLPPPDTARMKRALPRLVAVIRDAQASLVLTTSGIEQALRSHFDQSGDLHRLDWLNTEQIAADESADLDETWTPSQDDIAFLQYTSGSTSTPKGVMVSHGNVLAQCRILQAGAGYDEQSITCAWMPYHHDYGLVEGLIQPLFVGVPCYFMSPLAFIRRPIRWLEAISKYRVTHSQAPNFAYDLCVRKVTPQQRAVLDLSSWAVAANAAEPVRPQTLTSFFETFQDCGLRWETLAPAYGLAEATLIVTHTPPGAGPTLLNADVGSYERGKLVAGNGQPSWRIASSGCALNETRIEIVNAETHLRCAAGEVGEIWVAGPSIAQGYWNRPEDTERTFLAHLAETGDGPFLRTGDLGCIKDNHLYVTGRMKDLIIIRGLNHYPQDIESTVEHSHPALRPGCGAAFSIEVNGEEELVVVHDVQGKHQRSLDAHEVFSAIRAAVFDEHDLRLQAIVLLKPGNALKTTSGKIQRAAMKAAFQAGDLESVAKWDEGQVSKLASPSRPANGLDSVRHWLINWLADKAGSRAEELDASSKFADCGLDSMRAAELADDLENLLERRIAPTVFWSYPTIDALALHLSGAEAAPGQASIPATGGTSSATEAIAVIGMGCRFPGGVDSPEAYWELLRSGRDAISEIPSDRWNVDDYYDNDPTAPGKMYARHGAFIRGVDQFDPAFFGMTPRETADLDPQQRLLLQVAWESLEHAGIVPSGLRGSDAGVFVGLSSDDHASWLQNASSLADIDPYKTLGAARSIAAGRIAYVLGLHGPVVQLDTACSSSLVAVHQACQSLQAGECNLAMAGGVNLMLSPATMVALCKLTALAPDGHCKTFDAAANGYVRGEGCGLVVLKRLADAVRDGDTILARIRSATVNHDGASNGLTAPNGAAQELLVAKSLRKARVDAREVTYVEAHGTGTELGDPIELNALNRIYGEGRSATEPLYVGSMKTNIGHLEAAAGIAGLLKVVLMLRHGEIAPHLNFNTPNPHVDWDKMSIAVPTTLTPWPNSEQRKLAAVSSFGFSGTNAHVILEAADSPASRLNEGPASSSAALYVLPLSARSEESLLALTRKYLEHLVAHPQQAIEDICFSAATTRDQFRHRLAVVAASRDQLIEKLRAFTSRGDKSQVVAGTQQVDAATTSSRIGFLFTGQGTQYVGMGRGLYDSQPVFREAIVRCDELLRNHCDVGLLQLLYGEPSSECLLDQTIYTQPALFSLQYALVELWRSWGVRPDAVIGHSLGEYAAACAAGVFDLATGIELIMTRGRLMDALPRTGTMAVVMANEGRVRAAIEPFGEQVSIASINTTDTIVISGAAEAMAEVLGKMTAEGFDVETLNTSNAGHSALIDPMLEAFGAAADNFQYARPQIEMVSNLSGELAGDEVARGSYWVRHVREPVRFADGMQTIAETGCRTFVEIGPNPNLLAMAMGCVKGLRPRPRWLPSLSEDRSSWETMLYSLSEMYVHGANIDWQGFYQPYRCSRVPLPTYAFEQHSYPRIQPSLQQKTHSQHKTHSVSRSQHQQTSHLPQPQAVARKVDRLRYGLEDESRVLTERLDEIAFRFIIEAVKQLGLPWHAGAELSELELHTRIPERHRPKVARVFSRLEERGWIEQGGHIYRVTKAAPDGSAEALLDELQQEASCPECDLLGRAGSALAAIWKGNAEPLSVLFPDGATDRAVAFYSEAKFLAGYNRLAAEVLREALADVPASDPIRVLEVGAGTGGLTTHLLPSLPAERCEYVFTDLSPLFLHAAHERFSAFPFLRTELFDITKPPSEQGLDPNSFDVVVAANVLHATPRLHDTLTNVGRLLKPSGWLMLLEAANPPFWGDAVFTLIDGWWSFEDKELRPDYPLMRRDRWCRVLAETGFDEVASLNDAKFKDDSTNTLYLAQSKAEAPGAASCSSPAQPQAQAQSVPAVAASPAPPLNGEEANSDEPTLGQTLIDVFDEERLRELVLNHAARVMRLDAGEIEPTQALSELGLDSLMATELRAQLGQTLGRELNLNLLQMRRSVNEIAAYVRVDQANEDANGGLAGESLSNFEVGAARVHLVPLQPLGTQTPLFFVPAGYGDLFAFQEIAHAIGLDQPVYGLQPASAKQVKTFRQMSIYRLVSAYISEIRKVQANGPYLLSGYSAGAIIVVEIARELKRQGDDVGLLVIFDPPSHVPFWLDWFYAINYQICMKTGLIHVVRRLRSRLVRRLFHTVLDEGLRTHTTVTREHRVAQYPGRITHFRARLSQSWLVSLKPMRWFWWWIARDGIEVHRIPGSHYGMLRGAGQAVVVDELYDCLQRAKQSQNRVQRQDELP